MILIIFPFAANLLEGIFIFLSPDRYLAVIEFLFFNIDSRFPSAHISPPCLPAPGPMSII